MEFLARIAAFRIDILKVLKQVFDMYSIYRIKDGQYSTLLS